MHPGEVVSLIVSVALMFGLPGFVVWLVLRTSREKAALRHKERMAMIEKGIYDPARDPELVARTAAQPIRNRQKVLLAGMVLGAIGIAMLIPFVVGEWDIVPVTFASFAPLLVAASLIAFYFVLGRAESQGESTASSD